jgi:hypothetical protein
MKRNVVVIENNPEFKTAIGIYYVNIIQLYEYKSTLTYFRVKGLGYRFIFRHHN